MTATINHINGGVIKVLGGVDQMGNENGSNQFSAADPALGYLYQVRAALLWSLQRLKESSDFLVSIETLDDVVFENAEGEPTDLLQTKHHRVATANLTDASADLWKTLRIWIEGISSGTVPITASLVLVTTGKAPNGSAASYLKQSDRNAALGRQSLSAIAASSTNRANAAAYRAYADLSESQKLSLLEQVVIIDAAFDITNLDDALKSEVFWAAGREHHEAFLTRLEGWWLRRSIQQLVRSPSDRIGSVELEKFMSDLRDQFKEDSLPVDDDLIEFVLDDATSAAHEGSTFVLQLQIIKAGKHRVANCIRDYYRAFEQRSRWLREDLVVELELDKYEKRLIEEWNIVFEGIRDDLGEQAAEDAKETAARQVLQWAERTPINIRAGVTEPFISRGSMQMLADEVRVGWHPEFREKLTELLSIRGSS